jgi:hypothetical protein
MAKKIEIEFPVDFDKEKVCPIHLGRLVLGVNPSYAARLFFDETGALRMAVPKSAVETGAVIVYDDPPDISFGFFGPVMTERSNG